MTVHFIGAGPGAADLITLRAKRLIEACPVCLYAGSLVPGEILSYAPDDAHIVDSAPLHLDQIMEIMVNADKRGQDVARIHSGDPSIYGAISEQIQRLGEMNISYDITPGVPAFAAAAAAVGKELTVPEVSQTIILTRTAMQSSAMPEGEKLGQLAQSRATLAIHLSIRNLLAIARDLTPHYGENCPVIIAYRVGWPDQAVYRTNIAQMRTVARSAKLTRTALLLVGWALADAQHAQSALYDERHVHVLRPKSSLAKKSIR